MRSLIILIMLASIPLVGSAQPELSLPMPGYRLAASGPLAESEGGGLFVGKLDSLARDRRAARFGVLFPSAAPLLEIQDGFTGGTLASVSAAQWLGRPSAGWRRIAERSEATDRRRVDVFAVQQGKVALTLVRTIERIDAPHLPLGSGLRVSVGIADATVPSVRLVFRGVVEGATNVKGSLLTVASTEKKVPLNASLVLLWSPGTSVRLDGSAASRTVVARSEAITATTSDVVTAFAVVAAGTTSPVSEHQSAQATALHDHANGQPVRPMLVAHTVVDRPKAAPGDTVQYRFIYYNVGTAPAADVELANPVPAGTRYLDASAQGLNSAIAEEREPVEPPAVGRVTQLTWTFNGAIAPGASRWASFKVIIQ